VLLGWLRWGGVVQTGLMLISFGLGSMSCVQRGPSAGTRSPSPSTSSSPSSPSPTGTASGGGSVFVIVLENQSYDQVLNDQYFSGLASQYAIATNYHAITHPSAPNYLALTSGSTWGVRDDGYHVLPAQGLGDQLDAAGVSWNVYAEGLTSDCLNSPYPYAVKHNPFAYYGGPCSPNIVPMTTLAGDLAGTTPRLAWIIPNMCNDGHDCGLSTVASWLGSVVPQVVASAAWQSHGLLFITWDEDDGSSVNQVATFVIAPDLKVHSSGVRYDHYSLLATIEDRLGVGRRGAAKSARSMSDLVPA